MVSNSMPFQGPATTNWSTYGYATPAYRKVLKAALCLLMDFSMGPQSGQGVPAEPDNPGLAWELVKSTAPYNLRDKLIYGTGFF